METRITREYRNYEISILEHEGRRIVCSLITNPCELSYHDFDQSQTDSEALDEFEEWIDEKSAAEADAKLARGLI